MTAVADAPRNAADTDPVVHTDPAAHAQPAAGPSQAGSGTETEAQPSRVTAVQALEERNRALKLIDSGQATMAIVDTVSDTGVRVNGRTVAEVHLLVYRPDQAPYRVTRCAVVPEGDPGAEPSTEGRRRRIPVLVDPGAPENVLLRWDLRVAS